MGDVILRIIVLDVCITYRYGDRTQSTRGARIFATVWIFFGITFFAMYLGTITSVMTKSLQTKSEFEVEGKKVSGHQGGSLFNKYIVG